MINRIFAALLFCTIPLLAMAQAKPTPETALKASVEQLQSLIQQHQTEYKDNPQSFYKVVNKIVVPHFDVRYIAQIVMGRYWRQATPQQRDAFQHNFKDMMVRSYANALLENADTTKVEWPPSRTRPQNNRATVQTIMLRDNGQKVPINFSMHFVNGQWKIYDIVIDNISLVLNFRTQITADIQHNGIDAVIAKLKNKRMATPPGIAQASKPQ